jgi:hypothetical protein
MIEFPFSWPQFREPNEIIAINTKSRKILSDERKDGSSIPMICFAHWLIGNGANVFIWSNNWIPRIPSARPRANLTGMNNLARVQELILSLGLWNEDLICGIFIPSDAEAILSIPLSYSSPPYRLVWNQEQKGIFSVKTAYRLELSSTQATSSEPIGSNAFIF